MSNGTWSQTKKLVAGDGEAGDDFAAYYDSVTTISTSGGYAIVGAWGYDTAYTDEGAAYIFDRGTSGPLCAPTNYLLLGD